VTRRAEQDAAVAKVLAEFNAEIAELRRELLAQLNAAVAQIKAKYEKEMATLQRQLARPARS
jgi:recombinational DNA repair ATPase RecF